MKFTTARPSFWSDTKNISTQTDELTAQQSANVTNVLKHSTQSILLTENFSPEQLERVKRVQSVEVDLQVQSQQLRPLNTPRKRPQTDSQGGLGVLVKKKKRLSKLHLLSPAALYCSAGTQQSNQRGACFHFSLTVLVFM